MTLPIDVVVKMRRLFYAEHWKVGTIAAQLGVHHEAVERALGLERCGGVRPDGLMATRVMASKLDPYKPFIDETLANYPALGAMRVFHMAKERGTDDLAVAFERAAALAADPRYRQRVGALVLFGGFADFDATIRFCVTGKAQSGTRVLELTRDPLNSPVVYMHLLEHLGEAVDAARVREAWRTMVVRTWGRMELKLPGARDPFAHAIAAGL